MKTKSTLEGKWYPVYYDTETVFGGDIYDAFFRVSK